MMARTVADFPNLGGQNYFMSLPHRNVCQFQGLKYFLPLTFGRKHLFSVKYSLIYFTRQKLTLKS